ncbi:hypothetical protein [Noviherbaspirillum massiliense]|uniref:hypothetical protein n=1 Tax=Noviherbaspirillum massiliense TaxID=1465823 RepID=UPI000309908D|nr:hypothetical protein [Noviherbaspirillum massiliense]
MKTPRRSGQPKTHPVTARGGWRPSLGYLAIAFGLAVAGFYLLMSSSETDDTATPGASSASSSESGNSFATWTPPPMPAPATAQEASPRAPEGDADPTRDLTFYLARGEKPTMGEVIERLHQAGLHTGLGAFSPPGTRPPLVGIAVPEDFELPPGYVRHYQATDDGQRIEPILMFSPDYQLVDANNQPIEIPKDRVVPPELAPAGLPIRRIEIPAPTEPR